MKKSKLRSKAMPVEEGIIKAAITLIGTLREEPYKWTWEDMEDAQEVAGIPLEDRVSSQAIRLFYAGQSQKNPSYAGKQIPSSKRLETLLKALGCKVIVTIPEYSTYGTFKEFRARNKK